MSPVYARHVAGDRVYTTPHDYEMGNAFRSRCIAARSATATTVARLRDRLAVWLCTQLCWPTLKRISNAPAKVGKGQ
jgi:hypothetical protein